MRVQPGGYFPSAAEKASLAHRHRVGMSTGKLGAWPCEEPDVSNMAPNKGIREPVGAQGHSRVVGGGHVHASCHGGEGAGDIVPEGSAGDISMPHAGFQVG